MNITGSNAKMLSSEMERALGGRYIPKGRVFCSEREYYRFLQRRGHDVEICQRFVERSRELMAETKDVL